MFAKETYIARRAKLKQTIGSGLLLFLGNDESGMNYADNRSEEHTSELQSPC